MFIFACSFIEINKMKSRPELNSSEENELYFCFGRFPIYVEPRRPSPFGPGLN